MKYVFLLITLLLSCIESNTSKVSQTEIPKEKIVAKIKIEYSDFENKVFITGRDFDFTDNCGFFFECDCCTGDLVFLKDSNCYYIDYCIGENQMSDGKFYIHNNILHLKFTGLTHLKTYNWENENDTSVVDYFHKDTILKAWESKFYVSYCDSLIKLTTIEKDYSGIAIESKKTINRVLTNFKSNEN